MILYDPMTGIDLVCVTSRMSLYYMHYDIDQILGEKLINVSMYATYSKYT